MGLPTSVFTRRGLLAGGSLATAGLIATPLVRSLMRDRASVFVARNQRYDGSLVTTVREGLTAAGIDPIALRGKHMPA